KIISELNPETIETLIAEGTIAGGMIPKTETALSAIKGGVRAAVILDGREPNACLLELFTKQGAGTIIRATPQSGAA
ncbi:MAG: acetylglutamate kinase, partial [Paracoccaceae bacterium]